MPLGTMIGGDIAPEDRGGVACSHPPHMRRHAYGFHVAHTAIETWALQPYLGQRNIHQRVRSRAWTPQRFQDVWEDCGPRLASSRVGHGRGSYAPFPLAPLRTGRDTFASSGSPVSRIVRLLAIVMDVHGALTA